jgi:hypothetical protein
MKKNDLRTGMVVETRNGNRYLCFIESGTLNRFEGYLKLSGFDNDLNFKDYPNDFDIVKVYEPPLYNLKEVFDEPELAIWERKEPKELTVAEIEELLGYPIKVVK